MILAAALGAVAGAGAWMALRALAPRPTPLPLVLAGLDRPGTPAATPDAGHAERHRAGSAAAGLLTAMGIDLGRRHQALRLTGRTPERHALDKLLGASSGVLGTALFFSGLVALGLAPPPGVLVVAVGAVGVAGFWLPDVWLRESADRRRRAFRHALSSYLDLVNVILAGGGGIETALHAAAEAGGGWTFALIRRALDRARFTGRSPWDTFAELGRELGVDELGELAASVALAGSHGARIRQSLAAKADTLRGHQVAETESAAESATERMTIPVAVLLFGFLLFIAYPAVVAITTVSSTPLP